MPERENVKHQSDAQVKAIDNRLFLTRIRILQLLAVILSAAFALGLHLIFAR
ncbi:MAG: hypothetical protein ACXVDN_09815 [Ktedonobacteraceae bacterium]